MLYGLHATMRSKPLREQRTIKDELRIVGLSKDHSQRQIAEIIGTSRATVYAVQRKYHVTLSYGWVISSPLFRVDQHWDRQEWADAIDRHYYEGGLTLQQTADIMGVYVTTLRKRMTKLGYEPRPTGEAQRGKKRGQYNWQAWPECMTDGCTRRVKTGLDHCYECRGRMAA